MFSENLKKIRKEKGLSQEALSEKLNIVRQTISKWEKGLSIPDGDMLIKLSQVLEIPVETLLGTNGTLENKDAVNQAIQLQIINSLLENSNRGCAKMSGMMLIGVFISIIGTFFSVALMILATVNDVRMNGEVGIWGLLKGYGVMDFFVISIAAIILGIIIFGIGIYLKQKKEK
jgi:putative transcriptional regulator